MFNKISFGIKVIPRIFANRSCNFFSSSRKIEQVVNETIPVPQLRDYQQECIDACIKELRLGLTRKIAVTMATGGGKTFVFTHLMKELLKIPRFNGDKSNGILVLVHRRELAEQTVRTIQKLGVVDDDRVFIDMGKYKLACTELFEIKKHDDRPFVIVASVPTLARSEGKRMDDYDVEKFRAIIVDECHHSVSKSYSAIFDKFKCSKNKEETGGDSPFLLGFTATMSRMDKEPLKKVFDKLVYEKNINELINEKYLCDLEWRQVKVGLNLDKVEVAGKDFVLNSLAEHVNTDKVNEVVLKTYLQFKKENSFPLRSLLVFCVNVEHMVVLSRLFRLNGIDAQYVSGETKLSERDKIVQDFKDGKIPVLFNCGVFTEGTDIPNIDSIFLIRPTQSQPLLIQMIGRGLRTHSSKDKLLVVDFVDNKSLGLSISSTLNGKNDYLKLFGFNPFGDNTSGVNNADELLPGDVEYISFKSFKGIERLFNSKSKNSQLKDLYKTMNALNSNPTELDWIQSHFNCWVQPIDDRYYYKIELIKSNLFQLSFVSVLQTEKIRYLRKNVEISSSAEIDDIIKSYLEHLKSRKWIQDLKEKKIKLKNVMVIGGISEKQKSFLKKQIMRFCEKNAKAALDLTKFNRKVELRLNSMSKWDAFCFIYGYTVSRDNCTSLWIKKNILNTKANKKEVTNDKLLGEMQDLVASGWMR